MSGWARYALLAGAVVAFVAVSAGLARVMSAASAERHLTIEAIKAQAGGDARAAIAGIEGCAPRPPCRAATTARVQRLRSGGAVRILRLDGPPTLALGTRVARARIAWRTPSRTTVVQCVTLRRRGDVVHGFRVAVLDVGPPIGLQRSCPRS